MKRFGIRIAMWSACVLVGSTAANAQVLSLGFDEGSGTEVSDSASGLTGVFGFSADPVEDNFPSFVEAGPTGEAGDYALEFDGNDIVTVDDPDGILQLDGTSYTLEAYLMFEGVPGEEQTKSIIYSYGLPGGYAYSIAADRSLFTTTYGIADINPGNAVVPDDGEWHHTALVFDGTSFMFYVDGVLGDTVENSGPSATEWQRLYIGIEAVSDATDNPLNPFLGMIDRVKITKEALDPSEFDLLESTSSAKNWELMK